MAHFETAGIVENLQEGIIIVNLGGHIDYVNNRLEEMLSLTQNELHQLPIDKLIVGRDFKDEWKLIVDRVMEQGQFEIPSIKLQRRSGLPITVRMSLFSMRRPADKHSWIVFYIIDKSKEISTNQDLEKKYNEIKKKNAELVKISEMKTKFLGIASHELKTPLTSIKGYSELLLESLHESLTPEVERMVGRIAKSADKLHSVINDMLDVSRIEQNLMRLQPADVDLGEILNDVVDDLYHFFTKRNISPVINVAENLPIFYGDKVRLHQIITNLVSNAIKYSPDTTTVTMSITLDSLEDNFHIIIKDQGLGIADSEKETIFSPFYEISNTMNHSTSDSNFMGGGTGLGLSIVKGLVQGHGGTIWVESDGPDVPVHQRGSEFHILFPLNSFLNWDNHKSNETNSAELLETHVSPSNVIKLESTDKPRILIVDNDYESVELCKMILGSRYEVMGMSSGEQAVKTAMHEKERPDLILLNYYLPGLSGTDLSIIFKNVPETQDIPIAYLSAATQTKEILDCKKSGVNDFIVKPFTSKKLLCEVEKLLERTTYDKGI